VNGSNLEENYEELPAAVASSSSSDSGKSEDSFKVNLPFNKLRTTTIKCGPLWRREKIAFLDQWRKYWTGLYDHFLLMYSSENDAKPCVCVNVQGFVARPAPNCIKDVKKKKEATFEIVCPGKRDYQVLLNLMFNVILSCHSPINLTIFTFFVQECQFTGLLLFFCALSQRSNHVKHITVLPLLKDNKNQLDALCYFTFSTIANITFEVN
jgi:hypothetical protein